MTRVRPIYGSTVAISTGHPAATAAGWEILAQGGTVADAAVASAAVLAVVLPQACTLGGDAFILVHEASSGKTFGLNASGAAPALVDPETLIPGIPDRGAVSCSVPGVVGGWEALHKRFGRLPWPRVLGRSIELAAAGFPASPGLAQATLAHSGLLAEDPGAKHIFVEHGPTAAGKVFRQPALAGTLRKLATDGTVEFYRGATARNLCAYIESRGGWLRESDLAYYAPEWVEPLTLSYRGLDVAVMPPNSFGLYMLLQLAALRDVNFVGLSIDAAERYAALIAAAKAAFALGDPYVADPRAAPPIPSALLGPSGIDTCVSKKGASANRGGTAVVAIADAAGNAVAIVQSVFLVYGSAVADPATGVLLNDRMIGFTTKKGHPNRVAPRKRPAHTLNPVITLQGGKVRHVLLTPGGPGQTLTLTQILQAVWDHGAPLHDAAALPRWSMDLSGATIVEPELPEAAFSDLRRLGLKVQRGMKGSPFFGSAECVERLPDGGLLAVADDRREAHALAI